jgi:hypothetical protein
MKYINMFYNIFTTKENNKTVLFSLMNSLGFNMSVKYNDNEKITVEVKDELNETFNNVINNLKDSNKILNII